MRKMLIRTIDVVRRERASRASLGPIRPKHKVVDEKLAASGEEFRQRHLSLLALEDVFLLQLLPGQLAQLLGHRLTCLREFLLAHQKRPARLHPLLMRNHFVIHCFRCRHCGLLSLWIIRLRHFPHLGGAVSLGHAFASASRLRKAASPASAIWTHFGSGEAAAS